MTRRRWIYPGNGQEPVEVTEDYVPEPSGPLVMGDIQPYRSMLDGREITSRSRHREHLKSNGCIEIGNEIAQNPQPTGIPDVKPEQRKELIRAQVDAMRHDDIRRMLKRDLDSIRWNSRGR